MYITINRGKDVGIFITMISLRSIVSQNVSEENFKIVKDFLSLFSVKKHIKKYS